MGINRIDEIRARCEGATPGPWRKDVRIGHKPCYHIRHEGVGWPIASMGNYRPGVSNGNWEGDMDFIVHARADIPFLLELVGHLGTCENCHLEHECLADSLKAQLAARDARIEETRKLMSAILEAASCTLALGRYDDWRRELTGIRDAVEDWLEED